MFKEGQIIKIKAPFVKGRDGDYEYKHGMLEKSYNDFFIYEGCEGFAEFKIIKIVDLPKPYHQRIFFRKRLIEPSGKISEWKPLKITNLLNFKNIINGKKWKYTIEKKGTTFKSHRNHSACPYSGEF